MAQSTEAQIGKPIAVLLNDEVVTAPMVVSKVSDKAVISGRFSKAKAERIAGGIRNR